MNNIKVDKDSLFEFCENYNYLSVSVDDQKTCLFFDKTKNNKISFNDNEIEDISIKLNINEDRLMNKIKEVAKPVINELTLKNDDLKELLKENVIIEQKQKNKSRSKLRV